MPNPCVCVTIRELAQNRPTTTGCERAKAVCLLARIIESNAIVFQHCGFDKSCFRMSSSRLLQPQNKKASSIRSVQMRAFLINRRQCKPQRITEAAKEIDQCTPLDRTRMNRENYSSQHSRYLLRKQKKINVNSRRNKVPSASPSRLQMRQQATAGSQGIVDLSNMDGDDDEDSILHLPPTLSRQNSVSLRESLPDTVHLDALESSTDESKDLARAVRLSMQSPHLNRRTKMNLQLQKSQV